MYMSEIMSTDIAEMMTVVQDEMAFVVQAAGGGEVEPPVPRYGSDATRRTRFARGRVFTLCKKVAGLMTMSGMNCLAGKSVYLFRSQESYGVVG
jgi:hypothetical protein